MMKQDFELLAPAGSFEILKAVIEAGADAVYVGGSRYGARAYANNFTEEELLEAIDYVHLRGRKLFLTVNTLFKNSELNEDLYEYLLPYYERGLDAVIVQDLGALTYIREHFPKLPIHTSTQMTITGMEGAKLLKEYGAERIVLARELSIEEMKRIRTEADVELEVFIHGALCYSFSGQCLFSSMLGGRSGNRGRCAQPCRLPYAVLDEKKVEYKKESYVLSLKDLCGIEYLQKLREAGVYSLKIEGRMKQASYAAGVVAFYRKYIDLEKQITKEDMQHLYELGNRCGFTNEYFTKHNDKSMVTFDKPSYEKSNEALHQEIEAKYVGIKSRLPITGSLFLKKGQAIRLEVDYQTNEKNIHAQAKGPEALEAKNKPLVQEEVYQRMNKTGESPFYFTDLQIQMDTDVFVPNGVLNQLRRDALEHLQEEVVKPFTRSPEQKLKSTVAEAPIKESGSHREIICSCETMEQVDKCLERELVSAIYVDCQMFPKNSFIMELKACIEKIHKAQKRIYLKLPAIFRNHTKDFYDGISEELKNLPLDGFVIGNYEEILYFSTKFPESTLIANHNLYTYNDIAKSTCEKFGISVTTIPLELNRKEISKRENRNSEMVVYGYYPLMTTAGCVRKNTLVCDKTPAILYLKDRYHTLFPVKNFCGECYNVIYNSVPTLLFEEMNKLMDMNIHRFRLDFTIEEGAAVSNVLDLLEGKGQEIDYTKGHYKRGVE